MMKLKIYEIDEWGNQFESHLQATLLFTTYKSQIDTRNTCIENCFLYIPEEAFAFADYIKLKIDIDRMNILKVDHITPNFGVDKKNVATTITYFECMTDKNNDDAIDTYYSHVDCDHGPECSYEACLEEHHALVIRKDMLPQLTEDKWDTQNLNISFNVNNRIQTLKSGNRAGLPYNNPENYRNMEVETIYEHAVSQEVGFYIKTVPFEPTEDNFYLHYGPEFLDKYKPKQQTGFLTGK